MRRYPFRTALLLVLACLLVPWTTAEARRKKKPLTRSSLPAWVETAARSAPATSEHDAVILHEERVVMPLPVGGVQTTERLAVKILKPNGLQLLSDYAIYYVTGDRIQSVGSWALQPDDSVLVLDPDEDTSDTPAISQAMFSDLFARKLSIPGMRVGAVVAVEHIIIEQMDTGQAGWTFGSASRPTLLSRFELRVPDGWQYETTPNRGEKLEVSTNEKGTVIVGRDLEPLKRVPGRPSVNSILPKAWYWWRDETRHRGFADWDAVAAFVREMSDPALTEPGEAAELAEQYKPAGNEALLDSIAQAFDFASRDVRYVSIDLGLGIGAGMKAETPAKVCSKRYGDCKDKSYLMRALAEPWGVRTYAVLVRTKRLGRLPREVPSPGLFNHCIAAIALPDGVGESLWSTAEIEGIGRVAFLDATARNSSPWDLPWADQGTTALLVHPQGGILVELPIQPPTASSADRQVEVGIDADGKVLRADLEERYNGNSASTMRRYYLGKSQSEIDAAVLRRIQDRIPGSQVVQHELQGLDDSRADVREATRVEGGRLGKKIGNLLILEPGKAGYGVLNGTLPEPPREWNYMLGQPRQESLRISIGLPEGWVPEEIRPSLELDSKHVRAKASWNHSGGALVYERTVSLTGVEVAPDDYAEFRESMSRVRAEDRQAVVLVPE